MLTKLTIDGRHRNLKGPMTWDDIPEFAIITGLNGVGKSALLEAILLGTKSGNSPVTCYFSEAKPPATCFIDSRDRSNSAIDHEQQRKEIYNDLRRYAKSQDLLPDEKLKPGPVQFPELLESYQTMLQNAQREVKVKMGEENYHAQFCQSLLKQITADQSGHISQFSSVHSCLDAMIHHRDVSMKKLNGFLVARDFKYCIVAPENKKREFQLKHKLRKHKNQTIGMSDLSPGERLNLLTLLWLFENSGLHAINQKSIMLLDEPDAHLHPSLTKEFLDTVQETIVKKYGIQVIMTSHNPTTIAMASKRNLFVMKEAAMPVPAQSKQQIMKLLTSDFVNINETFRIVFVEADNDAKFFGIVENNLIRTGNLIPTAQLAYRAHGQKNQHGIENSSCDIVIRLLDKLVYTHDVDQSLGDFIFGIVDGDNKPAINKANLKSLARYSIENYIYDPIHLFFYLQQYFPALPQFIKLAQAVQCKQNALNELLALPIPQQTPIMQKIIDVIAAELTTLLNTAIAQADPNYVDIIKMLNNPRFNLVDNGKIIQGTIPVALNNGVVLQYPIVLMKIQGHKLEFIYSKIFGSNIDLGRFLHLFSSDAMCVPIELQTIFKDLHNFKGNTPSATVHPKASKALKKQLDFDNRSKDEIIASQSQRIMKLEQELAELKAQLPQQQGQVTNLSFFTPVKK